MKISGIYQIQSIIKPERIYIGSAENVNRRWVKHLIELRRNKHHSIKLQNHFNKYGKNDLRFSILLGCDKEDLLITEQYFLDAYDPWFNICKNARGRLGVKSGPLSEEHKRKIGESNKGKNKGRVHSLEQNTNHSKTMKGRKLTEETKRKISNAEKGRKQSHESNIKRRNTMKKLHLLKITNKAS